LHTSRRRHFLDYFIHETLHTCSPHCYYRSSKFWRVVMRDARLEHAISDICNALCHDRPMCSYVLIIDVLDVIDRIRRGIVVAFGMTYWRANSARQFPSKKPRMSCMRGFLRCRLMLGIPGDRGGTWRCRDIVTLLARGVARIAVPFSTYSTSGYCSEPTFHRMFWSGEASS